MKFIRSGEYVGPALHLSIPLGRGFYFGLMLLKGGYFFFGKYRKDKPWGQP